LTSAARRSKVGGGGGAPMPKNWRRWRALKVGGGGKPVQGSIKYTSLVINRPTENMDKHINYRTLFPFSLSFER